MLLCRLPRLVAGLLSLVLIASLPLFAQKITGDISGDVTDSSGAVVPNASVTALNVDTGLSHSATTSNTGNYRIPELPIGNYKVTATAAGFKTLIQTVSVQAGAVLRADFKLPVGERAEMVEVQGEAPLIDLSPNNNNYVDTLKIESVPLNGRDFNSLLAITPGVQRAPGGGFLAISIDGSRTTSNNYFIDGLYNNDRYYGDSAINETGIVGIPAVEFPPEAIEELSVQGTPSSEFGVKGGAPILLNMKSGTNAWHGSGTWVNHSGFGDAINYFGKHTFDNCGTPGECQKTNIHNNQINGTIGGPIVKDKAFFFLYYDAQRYKSLAVSSRAVPSPQDIQAAEADIAANNLKVDPVGATLLSYFPTSPTGFFIANTPTTASSNSFGVKFDYHPNSSNSIAVRYIFGDSFQSAPPFAGLPAGGAGHSADMFNSVAPSRAQMAGLSWTVNFSNNKILESRLGYTRFAQLLGVNNKIDPKSLGIDTGPLGAADFGVPYVYMYHLGYGGYIGGVQGYPLVTRPDATWDWSEHFSWVKGNHTIKIGGNFQRAYTNSIRNEARTGLALGYFSYYAPITGGVQDDIEQLLLGKADLADRSFGDTHRHITQNSVGFYGQDDWKIKPRLTLSYGLRWDINGTMRDTNNLEANFIPGRGLVQVGQGISGIHNVDYHDFGPHVGVAWDVFGNGKMAVRAGYSRTYDVPNFGAFASPYSFAHARAGVFTEPNLNFFNVSNLSGVAGGSPDFFTPNPNPSLPPIPGYYSPNNPLASCYNPAAATGDYICFDSAAAGPLYGANPTSTPPFNAFSVVQNFKTPHYDNYNVSIQDELFRNNVLTLTYAGQRGGDLLIFHDLNASPLGSACTSPSSCDPFRPFASSFPTLRHVIQATNAATSQYDSLQASYNQRNWHGLDTQYNLTWSKCFDYNSVNRGGGNGDYPQLNNMNPVGSTAPAVANFRDNRGLCDHDVALNFNVGGLYSVPAITRLGKRAGDGWQLSTIFTAISGRPFTPVLSGSDNSGQGLIGASIRPAYDGSPIQYNSRNPDNYVVEKYADGSQQDPCGGGLAAVGTPLTPFFFPCPGTVGNARRNMLRGPGLAQWDMSLIKNTKLTERLNMQIRWEVYNLLNRGNFYYFPNNVLTSCSNLIAGNLCAPGGANFAQIAKTSDVASGNPVIAQGGPRNMNFSLKFIF